MSVRAPVGPVNLTKHRICIGRGLAAIRPDSEYLLTLYAFHILRSLESEITGNTGAAFASISKRDMSNIELPLPPLNVQQEIVAEIESYQKVIDGARAVVDNYRPRIPTETTWPLVSLGKICFMGGKITKDVELGLPYLGADSIESNTGKLLKLESARSQGEWSIPSFL